jgi:hypothetical protein
MKNPIQNIWLDLATTRQAERWAQARIAEEHYLHAPLDALDDDADQAVRRRSAQDARAQRYRASRAVRYEQGVLL